MVAVLSGVRSIIFLQQNEEGPKGFAISMQL